MIPSALLISLLVAALSTAMAFVLGTAAGWLLARRPFAGRELVDALLSLPLVLPPTVTGYYLLVLLGRKGPLGGLAIPFTLAACVVAATVMAFPLVVRAARVAFEEIDPRQRLASFSLGHGAGSTLWRVELPLARRGLAAGAALGFARALGEFGATLMLAGNIPGRTQTLALAIFEDIQLGREDHALLLVGVTAAMAFAVLFVVDRLLRRPEGAVR